MGASPQPRKNPYMAQGLVPGATLRLATSRREGAEFLVTRLEHVSDSALEVLVPMRKLQKSPLTIGATVHGAYIYQKKNWSFDSDVIGTSADGSVQYLRLPARIDCSERRGAFRLQTAIKPSSLYRLVIEKDAMPDDDDANVPGTVIDLSEGGLCLSSSARIARGERLGIQASLDDGVEFTARMQVTGVDDPAQGQRNRRIHCQFTDISRGDKDRVAKFLIRRQLEMRRRGQI
jgi:hypothetical protein